MNMSVQSINPTPAARGASAPEGSQQEILALLKELLSVLKQFLSDKIGDSDVSDPTKEAAQQGADDAYGSNGCGGGGDDEAEGSEGAPGAGSTSDSPEVTTGGNYGEGNTPEDFPINLSGYPADTASLAGDEGQTEISGGNYPDTADGAVSMAEQYAEESKSKPEANPLPQDMAYRDEIYAAAKTYGIDPILLGKLAYRESSLTPGLNSAEGDPAAGYVRGLMQSNDASGELEFKSSNQVLNEALNGARQLRGEINGAVRDQGLSGQEALQKALNYYNTGNWDDAWADFSTQNGAQSEGHSQYWQWIAGMQLTEGMDHDNGT